MAKGSVRREADRIISQNVRTARLLTGRTQTQLGHALGVTFQQYQKYEKGDNRISSGTLVKIAEVLQCPVTELLRGCDDGERAPLPRVELTADSIRLLRAFNALNDIALRKATIRLIERISKDAG